MDTVEKLPTDKPDAKPVLLTSPQPESAAAFFERERMLITDLAQGLPVTFEPGDGWAIDSETGKATYDPKFFTEQGYTPTQAIFATMHEIDHAVELTQMLSTRDGQATHARRKELKQKQKRLHILEDCLIDAADNQRVLQRAPALHEETERLYKEKLFPDANMKDGPRHIRFAEAILRQAMLPDEQIQLDAQVEAALQELQHVKGKRGGEKNIIALVTDPSLDLVTKIKLIERYVEPIYERLFQADVNDSDRKRESLGQREFTDPETNFESDYTDFDGKFPAAMNEATLEIVATGGVEARDIGSRQTDGYEAEHQVSIKDVAAYQKEYRQIEHLIEGMREQFRRIVAERLIPRRHLSSPQDEGALIASGLAAQAQLELQRGTVDVPVYQDYVGIVRTEQVPAAFEFTCVFDRSASMRNGGKMEEQRRAAILALEALKEFMDIPKVRSKLIDPDLAASSEIRSFGGSSENVVIKPLSPELTEHERVQVYKTLGTCPGSATEDYVVLGQIIQEMHERERQVPGYLAKVKGRKIKKLVAVFSDGASSDQAMFDKQRSELESLGVKVVDYRRIRVGTIFTSQMATILNEALNDLCYSDKKSI